MYRTILIRWIIAIYLLFSILSIYLVIYPRKYLKTREDTVKCIVQSLLDEGLELREELMKGEGLQLEDIEVTLCRFDYIF